jgi:hypothetical protein
VSARLAVTVLVGAMGLAGCGGTAPVDPPAVAESVVERSAPDDSPVSSESTPASTHLPNQPGDTPAEPATDVVAAKSEVQRPVWLGRRALPLRGDGFGEVLATPPELVNRRLPTIDLMPAPDGREFTATAAPVPDDVAARSTWTPQCPVALDELAYLTVSFWGFDDRPHTGELLVHTSVADSVVDVFRRLYEARFPIEQMRIVAAEELDAPPTGDGNNTTAFACRPIRGGTRWSQHAYGLAIDVNPFHNPYHKGGLVLPELASAYLDRGWLRPGMVVAGDVVTEAFAAIGWMWGGDWQRSKDWMHFSLTGR